MIFLHHFGGTSVTKGLQNLRLRNTVFVLWKMGVDGFICAQMLPDLPNIYRSNVLNEVKLHVDVLSHT